MKIVLPEKWRASESLCAHSSRAHAYFSVIWVSVYFCVLCGLAQTEIHEFCAFWSQKDSPNRMPDPCGKQWYSDQKGLQLRAFMRNLNGDAFSFDCFGYLFY